MISIFHTHHFLVFKKKSQHSMKSCDNRSTQYFQTIQVPHSHLLVSNITRRHIKNDKNYIHTSSCKTTIILENQD